MNAFSFVSKSFFVLLVLLASLSSCQKSEKDPEPEPEPEPVTDLATKVAGKYVFRKIVVNGKLEYTAEEAGMQGSITLTRKATSKVSMAVKIQHTDDNSDFLNQVVENLAVTEGSGGGYILSANGNQLATTAGKTLTLTVTDGEGNRYVLTNTK
ncbi:hypothetical protein BWI93_25810 [Siphonobacter sp. BAB-5385]|uniref:hypothetical protein n=1 Tax=Siphonobacter sp. BAB-5385 TaxID=1864822 RepID=UPI000B9EB740|nr:hypothetical protein [Siphonobacter sp. BAB-5385]OZI05358.1 hypothetical protein BWI93_25810 [Siphonobacter sp. BAB-5385]